MTTPLAHLTEQLRRTAIFLRQAPIARLERPEAREAIRALIAEVHALTLAASVGADSPPRGSVPHDLRPTAWGDQLDVMTIELLTAAQAYVGTDAFDEQADLLAQACLVVRRSV